MKAISIWQPFASLIALEVKRIETRHWQPPRTLVGRRIAIHAGKNTREIDIVHTEEWKRLLEGVIPGGAASLAEPPLGCVLATAVLRDAVVMDGQMVRRFGPTSPVQADRREGTFGWFAPGRVAWLLDDVVRFDPIPCRGAQGVFNLPYDVDLLVQSAERNAQLEARR